MAYSLNRAQLIGNVVRDPEARQTSTGRTVVTFSVATNRSWTGQDGQRRDEADFHNVVVWGKLAEIAAQYLKKGRKVYVEGRMQTRDWTGEDGQKRYRTEIVAENFILLDRAGAPADGGSFERESNSSAVKPAPAPQAAKKEEEMSLDDLPF